MILTVHIPVAVAETYGKYRNRLHYTTKLLPIVTSVSALRRIPDDTVAIEVDAFIPEQYRSQIDGVRSKWITPEVRRCVCYIHDNMKSLRPFLESDAIEWFLKD